MYVVRSFGAVSTCSGWGVSHMGRFRPLRMTICEGGRALIGLGVWMGNSYFPLLHFYEPARVYLYNDFVIQEGDSLWS